MIKEGIELLRNDDKNIMLIDNEEDEQIVIVYKFEDEPPKSLLLSFEEKYSDIKLIYNNGLIVYDNFLKNEKNKKEALNLSFENLEKFLNEIGFEYEICNKLVLHTEISNQ
jgi:hypothetical protein